MASKEVFHEDDSGYLGGVDMHPELWRVHGNEAQMVDASEHGPLSPAVDSKVESMSESVGMKRWPNAPGYIGDEEHGEDTRRFTGALDGAGQAGDPRKGAKRGKSWPTELNNSTRKPDLVGY